MKEQKIDEYFGCYGSKISTSQVQKYIIQDMRQNFDREQRFSSMIWGKCGCSKTSSIRELTNYPIQYKGKVYDGIKVIYIATAQLEQLGDIIGMPQTYVQVIKGIQSKYVLKVCVQQMLRQGWQISGRQQMRYVAPSWVPEQECPGIILFDDANRASQRILKGMMQLVQDYKTIGWQIPMGWTIVFTGNPDNYMNQVIGMDSAQLTRFKHYTLVPDVRQWSRWAYAHGIDERGINYLLKYPQMMSVGNRTNLRTLSEYFKVLHDRYKVIQKEDIKSIRDIGLSLIDEQVVQNFIIFLMRDVDLVIQPEQILGDIQGSLIKLHELMNKSQPRIDIVNITNERLKIYLSSERYIFKEQDIKVIQSWILSKDLPLDCSYGFIRELLIGGCKYGKKFISGNKEILQLVQKTYKYKG